MNISNIKLSNINDNIPDTYEIALSLFSECNLNCAFCFQQKKTKLNQNIFNKIFDNFNNIIEQIQSYKIKNIRINMWGGQLFNDNYPEQYYIFYKKIISTINDYANNADLNTSYNFMSNGIFKNQSRVYNFLNEVNGIISFSYDPIGRYKSKQQIDILKSNIQFFKEKTHSIALTLTKPNIQYILSTNDDIINNYKIHINFYFPNTKWQQNMPSDKLIYEFFLWGITNKKYNINVIKNIRYSYFYNPNYQDCTCKFSIQFINEQWTKLCTKRFSAFSNKQFYGNYANCINQNNSAEIKNTLYVMKRGCLFCQNYNKCIMICPGSQLFKNYNIDKSFCPIKQIYNFIKINEGEYKIESSNKNTI